MAKKPINAASMLDMMENQQKASEKAADKPKAEKTTKPNSDYIRLDLKPSGYDLKAYVNKRCGDLSLERDKKISSTAFIQELIIKDMEENQGKVKKQTKREKILSRLENMDDKKLSAIATLLDIQIV